MRNFIALMLGAELGEQLRERLLPELERLQRAFPGAVRIHVPEDLHLTLAFLGEQHDGLRSELVADLAQTLADVPAPRLRLREPGAFPDHKREPGRERVLWAGVEDLGGHALERLVGAVRERCLARGIELDPRPFRAHVTLARVRLAARGQVREPFFAQNPGLNWQPRCARWVVSLKAGGPPAYRPEQSFPLA